MRKLLIAVAVTLPGYVLCPATPRDDDSLSTAVLKKHSLEELMDMDITSLAKKSQRWFDAPAAAYVISGDEIRRSGATSIPEALRLAPNLDVAQVNASQWAISARGFSNVLANKLLVMIDGRSVYTPLYAGVFWDVQDVLLEDIDRIEVISGPGGTLWGANAVNGIINIITRNAAETRGLFVEGGAGTRRRDFAGIRYGGLLSPDLSYRVYGKTFRNHSTALVNGGDARDDWTMSQAGMRLDWEPDESNSVTLQSDYLDGKPDPDGGTSVVAAGGNVLGKWSHTISANSDFQVQLYYDRTWRDFGNGFAEGVSTYDVDGQHRFQLDRSQEILWGVGVRMIDDREENLPLFGFFPGHKLLRLYSAFLQDGITLMENRLVLTMGSKFERNDYTGLEFQPGGRLAWTPSEQHIFWCAVSRAVKTPSRIDREFLVKLTPTLALLAGNPDLASEEMLAYELGWRMQPGVNFSLAVSTFYNVYDNVRSAEPGPPPFNIPITLGNGVRGETDGVELAIVYQATGWWRVHGGYRFLEKRLSVKPESRDLNSGTAESDDPKHQFMVHSSFDVPGGVQLDAILRWVGALPKPVVPGYVDLDVRLGWKPNDWLELQLVGQNLLNNRHAEFIPDSPSPREIERNLYGKISLSL